MSLSKVNEFVVNCDFCDEGVEWVKASNQKEANTEIEKKGWEVEGVKHRCDICMNKRAKRLLRQGARR